MTSIKKPRKRSVRASKPKQSLEATLVAEKPRKASKKRVGSPKGSRARTPPHPTYPDWSHAKFWGFIRSALRAAFSRWPPKYEVLASAKRKYDGPNKLQKWQFQCNKCQDWFKQKDVSVDHVEPAGRLNGFEDLAGFVERMFVGVDGLQVLCTQKCHKAKTALERSNKK